MVTTCSVTRFVRLFRLLPKTVIWLQKQADDAQAIDQLVAKAEAEEQNVLIIAAIGKSKEDQQLEICYEQIETLKQLLKHQTLVSQKYHQEVKDSHQKIENCNQEIVSLHQRLLNLDAGSVMKLPLLN